jgi:cyclic pyranopterin phosphate synthase
MTEQQLQDAFNRHISYLRVSVTDRCNLRCRYCAPANPEHIARRDLLSLEEIYRLICIATRLGIRKVRLTGGEPLVRKGIVDLIGCLARKTELQDIALTTNGTLLSRFGSQLKEAGLRRLNISLDSLKSEKYSRLTGADLFHEVWTGIMKAAELGFAPIKINTVVMKGYNDDEIEALAHLSRRYPFHIRFIEYMPIGTQPHMVHKQFYPADLIRKRLEAMGEMVSVAHSGFDGPAQRFRFKDGIGEIGLITSMSAHFCGSCNRMRLTASGHLRPCLLSDEQINIIEPLRRGADDAELVGIFRSVAARKKPEHLLTFEGGCTLKGQMVRIGG